MELALSVCDTCAGLVPSHRWQVHAAYHRDRREQAVEGANRLIVDAGRLPGVPPSPQPPLERRRTVFECGTEGGGISIDFDPADQTYRLAVNEIGYDMEATSRDQQFASMQEALLAIRKYPWQRFVPIVIDKLVVDDVERAWRERVPKDESADSPLRRERWESKFREARQKRPGQVAP